MEIERSSQAEAKGIAHAISDVLINENDLFRSGTKESMTIKVISGPIIEQNPTVKTLVFGAIAGALLGGSLLLLRLFSRASRRRFPEEFSFQTVDMSKGVFGNVDR